MTKKSVFEAVGGLSTELAVAFNDIDYCMKVRALGKTGSVCTLCNPLPL